MSKIGEMVYFPLEESPLAPAHRSLRPISGRTLICVVFAVLLAGVSTGFGACEEPPHITDENVGRLYARVLGDTDLHEITSPDDHYIVAYRQINPGVYGHNFSRIWISDAMERPVASFDMKEHAGRVVALARWSPDSRYCVFTTISAGGHSPWHFDPYVLQVHGRKFHFMDDGSPVIDPGFRFEQPATLRLLTREGIMRINLRKRHI